MRGNMVAAAGEMVRSREEAGEISKARYRLAGIRPAERRYPMVVQYGKRNYKDGISIRDATNRVVVDEVNCEQ